MRSCEVLNGIQEIPYCVTTLSTVRIFKECAYLLGACEKTVQYLCDTVSGFKIEKIELDYPISDDEILTLTESALKSNKSIKLILMDAISSLPGVLLPWEKVCQLCRQYEIYSLVDAAHAVTQIPVDISQS